MDGITNELLAAVGAALGAAILAVAKIVLGRLDAWMARTAVVGAVERAAGLALEMQRTGSARPALDAAVAYVETAVPDALKRTGAAPHLTQMVQGAIGVLRAQGTTPPPR